MDSRGLVVGLVGLAVGASTAHPSPVRLAGRAFGAVAEAEVRDLEEARAEHELRRAFATLAAAEAAATSFARAARDAGGAAIAVPPEIWPMLVAADAVCRWSDGAVSALGGVAARLWGLDEPVVVPPSPAELEAAASGARCDRLILRPAETAIRLASGSELDFRAFARGWAIDRAVDQLRAAGVGVGWIGIGNVQRGFGGGPDGRGWPVELTATAHAETAASGIRLVDRAFAAVTPDDGPVVLAGEVFAPYLDLRRARPAASGIVATYTVSELAIDVQSLAVALFVLGAREGQLRLGGVRPAPSVLWLLGTQGGDPVFAAVRWSAVPKR
jgi:thiamine biosynthesis lipoprotein